jgi:hypothetical protein
MGFLNKLLGFRWSLYVVQNGNQLMYAMHEDSVMPMLGYVMGYFARNGRPAEPWSLYLNFNHKHQMIQLGPEHFTADGTNITPTLMRQIESIDSGWRVKAAEPIFEEAATKKRIKINEYEPGLNAHDLVHAIFNANGKPRELTFFSVMDEVFGVRG